MSSEKNTQFDCSFVSIHYIICECGETFPSENDLKAHLVKEHPRKRERKEFKCGVCGSTFKTENKCIEHYESTHIADRNVKTEEQGDEDTKSHLEAEMEMTAEDEYMYNVELEEVKDDEEMMDDDEVIKYEEVVQDEEVISDEQVMDGETLTEENEGQMLHIPEDYGQLVQASDGRLVLLVNDREAKKATIITTEMPTSTNKISPYNYKPLNIAMHNKAITVNSIPKPTKPIIVKKESIPNLKNPIIVKKDSVQSLTNTMIVKRQDVPNLAKPIIIKRQDMSSLTQPIEVKREPRHAVLVKVATETGTTNPGLKNTVKHRQVTRKAKPKNFLDRVCESCGKKYASNAALKYHQRIHTGERPFKCHFCPKAFTMPLFLQIHIRTHTGERPYACGECPKAFSNRAALLRHERVHTGVRPYACPMCGKAFTQSNSMKLHVTTVHLKQPAPYKSKSRKLKAQENALKRRLCLKEDSNTSSEVVVKSESEQGQEEEEEVEEEEEEEREQVYEIIESEEVNADEDDQCYTIVY